MRAERKAVDEKEKQICMLTDTRNRSRFRSATRFLGALFALSFLSLFATFSAIDKTHEELGAEIEPDTFVQSLESLSHALAADTI